MKQLLLILTISVIHTCSYGQIKSIYLNDDLIEISKADFERKTDPKLYFDLRFESDTLIAHVKVDRYKKGRISKIQLDAIQKELSTARQQKIEEHTILVINYYPGSDRCNSTSLKGYRNEQYERYIKKIKKFKNVNQFFVYKSPEGTADYGEQIKWFPDKSAIIENTFFPIHYPCGGYVLINSNGSYYVQKGEHSLDPIVELLKDKEDTFSE